MECAEAAEPKYILRKCLSRYCPDFFENVKHSENKVTMKCKVCSTEVKTLDNSASNLYKHYQTKHKSKVEDMKTTLKRKGDFDVPSASTSGQKKLQSFFSALSFKNVLLKLLS